MSYLLLYIHIVGWFFAVGNYFEACDATNRTPQAYASLMMFFTWPHYLGYALSSKT